MPPTELRPTGPFPEALLAGGADSVARNLLGAVLLSTVEGRTTAGRIVETEAYLGLKDPASHSFASIGRTRRNDAMFAAPGTLYVYLSYGVHHCANVVVGPEGVPEAVLIRALEPVRGMDVMMERRGRGDELCSGPGRLSQALGISLVHNHHRLSDPPVRLFGGASPPRSQIGVSPRIGISKAADWPLRFFVRGHAAVRQPRW